MRPRFRISLAAAAALIAAWTSLVLGAMPVPGTSQVVEYEPLKLPVLSDDPSQARPVAVGEVAEGGGTFNLHIGLHALDDPVDVYLGLQASFVPGELFMFTSDGGLYPVSQAGLLPWKVGVSVLVEENLFEGGIPVAALPPGVYTLYLAVAPAGSLEAFYLWVTSFLVPGLSLQEVEAGIIGTLGPDQGFQALWLALDEGYSLGQIVAASMTGRLASNGDIYGFMGNLVAPENPSPDIFTSLVETAAKRSAVRTEALDEIDPKISQLIDRIGEMAARVGNDGQRRNLGKLAMILAFLAEGYSPSQVAGLMIELEGQENPAEVVLFLWEKFPVLRVKFPDGSSVQPSGQRQEVCNLEKSVSDLRVSLSGDDTLVLKPPASGGSPVAAGSWTAQVTGGTGPYDYFFYWGVPQEHLEKFADIAEPSKTAGHSFIDAKTYHLVARVVDRSNGKEANSSVLAVSVAHEPPAFPYTHCEISVHVNETLEFQGLDDPVHMLFHQSTVGIGAFQGTTFLSEQLDPALFPVPNCAGRMEIAVFYDPSLMTWAIADSFYAERTCTAEGNYGTNVFEVLGDGIILEVKGLTHPELSGYVAGEVACTFLQHIKNESSSCKLIAYSCTSDSYVLIRCYTP